MSLSNELCKKYNVQNINELMDKIGVNFKGSSYFFGGEKFSSFDSALYAADKFFNQDSYDLTIEAHKNDTLVSNSGKLIFISTTNINIPYDVIDIVFASHGEEEKGFLGLGGINMENAIKEIRKKLIFKAKEIGADAIIGCKYEIRVATTTSSKQVFEVYCFGTAVSLIVE